MPTPDDAGWIAGRFRHYLDAPADIGLDSVLGLTPAPGFSSWRTMANQIERDRLLRRLGTGFPGSTNARAAALQQRLTRYQSSAWLRDRVTKQPARANALIFELLSLDAEPPTGISRLRQILSS